MFKTYGDLLDAARPVNGLWHTITFTVNKTATQDYKARHVGRYNERGIEKEEAKVADVFLGMVNAFMEKDAKGQMPMPNVATLILDTREHVYIAWAVAQRLAGRA